MEAPIVEVCRLHERSLDVEGLPGSKLFLAKSGFQSMAGGPNQHPCRWPHFFIQRGPSSAPSSKEKQIGKGPETSPQNQKVDCLCGSLNGPSGIVGRRSQRLKYLCRLSTLAKEGKRAVDSPKCNMLDLTYAKN